MAGTHSPGRPYGAGAMREAMRGGKWTMAAACTRRSGIANRPRYTVQVCRWLQLLGRGVPGTGDAGKGGRGLVGGDGRWWVGGLVDWWARVGDVPVRRTARSKMAPTPVPPDLHHQHSPTLASISLSLSLSETDAPFAAHSARLPPLTITLVHILLRGSTLSQDIDNEAALHATVILSGPRCLHIVPPSPPLCHASLPFAYATSP